MKLLIDISEYNAEYIKNAYGIPQNINMVIAEAIINGKQIPTPHGRLIDASQRITVAIPNGLKCITVDKFIDEYAVRNAPTVIEAED